MSTLAFHLWVAAIVNGGYTSCALLPLIRNVMENYNSIHAVPVVLWATDGSSGGMDSWVKELLISRVVGTPHDLLPNVFLSYNKQVMNHDVAYFAPILPQKVPQTLIQNFTPHFVPLFPKTFILISRAGQQIEHAGISMIIGRMREYCSACEMLSINEAAIYVWSHESRSCKIRLRTLSIKRDDFHEQGGRRYVRNVRIFVDINPVTVGLQYNSSAPSEMLAYLNALVALTVTPVLAPPNEVRRYWTFEDVFLTPQKNVAITDLVDIHAVYGYSGVGLFANKYPTVPGSYVASWSTMALFVLVVPLVGRLVTTVFHGCSHLFPRGSDRLSTIFTFLGAAIFAGCPPFLRISCIVLRILKAAWLLGTLFIACSVQCFLTSKCNMPAYSRPAQNLDELYELFRLGKSSPCFVSFQDCFEILYSYKDKIFFRTMAPGSGSILTFDDPGECYFRAMNGTAAFINIADAPTMRKAHEFGLTRANDLFDSFLTAAPVSKKFRYIRQHRRLVRALAESGLIIREERKHDRKRAYSCPQFPSGTRWWF